MLFLVVILLLLGTAAATTSDVVDVAAAAADNLNNNLNNDNVYRYNICNGLSNQLLYHSAEIAIGKFQNKRIEIPDYFIVNGVQLTGENVVPTAENSVSFEVLFDKAHFLQTLQQELGINATFVQFDFSKQPIPCAGWQSIYHAEPQTMRRVLEAFRPSLKLQKIIEKVTSNLQTRGMEHGICLHHRDGQDWHQHCAQWSNTQDGVYRGNCLGVPGRSFVESLEDRGLLHDGKKWVYYWGDHETNIPRELTSSANPFQVVSRHDFMDSNDLQAVADLVHLKPGQPMRDLWALIDFHICGSLPHFIGNSASTFSAIQIALRKLENSFWYNSQSIPLADMWRVYEVPIVYTYTELSMESGKRMLQASILSVRKHMPNVPIHMLYHDGGGKGGRDPSDQAFRLWLQSEPQNVILHKHKPAWSGPIETMRKNGALHTSHLFGHAGNYLGTWQRIDIPHFIHSEYCLVLDADTIVLQPFTLADFGLDLTYGVAMASEMEAKPEIPFNAGVMLMNIPKLRQTYADFLDFILQHVSHPVFEALSPSDQGAYLDFYRKDLRYMSNTFNFKAYWKPADVDHQPPVILHFHGTKPHDFLKKIMGDECDIALEFICKRVMQLPYLCTALANFAQSLMRLPTLPNESEDSPIVTYCKASFLNDKENSNFTKAQVLYCSDLLHMLSGADQDQQQLLLPQQSTSVTSSTDSTNRMCSDFPYLLRVVLYRLPNREFELLKEPILRITHNVPPFPSDNPSNNFGSNIMLRLPNLVMLLLITSFVVSKLVLLLRRRHRKRTQQHHRCNNHQHHHCTIRNFSRFGMTGMILGSTTPTTTKTSTTMTNHARNC